MDLISEQKSLQALTEKERIDLIVQVRHRRRERTKPKPKKKKVNKHLEALNNEQLHELLAMLQGTKNE